MSAPDPAAIRVELDRIAGSGTFAGSERMSRLLRYLVDRTLAGEAAQLKEYVLGVEVFDRDQHYDPRLDSIVRVEARRLRSKLEEYYQGPGAQDEVLISIPKGSYVPVFETRPAPPIAPVMTSPAAAAEAAPAITPPVPPAARPASFQSSLKGGVAIGALAMAVVLLVAGAGWRQRAEAPGVVEASARVSIAVLPFATFSDRSADQQLAARLTDGVTTELARLGALSVASHTSALQFAGSRPSIHEVATALGADVVMESSMHVEGETVTVDVRLVDAATDRKFWVESFRSAGDDVRGLQLRIAQAVSPAAVRRTPHFQ